MFRFAVVVVAIVSGYPAAAQEELPEPFLHDGNFRFDEETVTPPVPRHRLPEGEEVVVTAPDAGDNAKFYGTWRLISFASIDDEGQQRERPMRGQLTYTQDGLMSAQLMPEEEEEGDGSTRPYYAYFGMYEIDPETQTVAHKVEASNVTTWVNDTLVRHYTFDENDRLILIVREDDRDTIILEWARTELAPEQ